MVFIITVGFVNYFITLLGGIDYMHSIFILKIVQIYYATTPFAVFKKHKNSSYSLMRLIPERWWRRSFRNCV